MALVFLGLSTVGLAQFTVSGTVTDKSTGETMIGASVIVKGTTTGGITDIDGKFEFTVPNPPPFILEISYIGYVSQEFEVTSLEDKLKFKLSTDAVLMSEVEIVGKRISEKQQQEALTVESVDLIAIKESPSGDFYESLGNLKGVDMTAASFGFKIINTRGFNSTSPVRSLQLIDGVDNQSPGLNFSLGNFLGASDLDMMRVDVVAGASTAFYGPGAFNGVINMTTKSPWNFPGLSASIKVGERNMQEYAVRWAHVLKNKEGKDRFAYKLNAYYLKADDWLPENYDASTDSNHGVDNPGRYDAVNIYGDEDVTFNNDYSDTLSYVRDWPGLGVIYRNGYREVDLSDHNTDNLKLGGSLHYKFADSLEISLGSSFSTGSTVYQGDNRYRLKNIKFFQHRLQLEQKDRWFIRSYLTHEDAGDSYDIFTTALRMQDASVLSPTWNNNYANNWNIFITPQIEDMPGYFTISEASQHGITSLAEYYQYFSDFVNDNQGQFSYFHELTMDATNAMNDPFINPFYVPGTQRFDSLFNDVTGRTFTEGGSRFYDKSKLFHIQGEYKFTPKAGDVILGGNFRQYLPDSRGTIFRDTADVTIKNSEFGIYLGFETKLFSDLLKATATVRMDKNENFDPLFSPAVSLVYTPNVNHNIRLSFSSAIRNPTLADQYLYYNVGRAILLGNLEGQFEEGVDSLFTVESFNDYRAEGLNTNALEYFNVGRIKPEQVKTLELGYRGTLWEKVYVDAGAYYSWYQDFIGYVIGISAEFDQQSGFPIGGIQPYRVAANATGIVNTLGAQFGMNYYWKRYTFTGNYSYNKLTAGEDDPIIPAFNTPEHKFNLGASARDLLVPFTKYRQLGFGVNFKWIDGFVFEGSPQFTGPIDTYWLLDAQVNVNVPKIKANFKLGASNITNNQVYLVYGGPTIGRLTYLQINFDLGNK